jgi:peptide/nickel transport system substrate-binding protein
MKVFQTIGLVALLAAGSAVAQDRSQTLIYGADFSDLITLDPQVVYEFSGGLIADNLYETLVKYEGADLSTLKPGLAESWKADRAANGWTVTFNLRKGSKFSSGNEVTAKDVVFSFDRAIQLKGPSSFLFNDIAQIKVGSTKAISDYVVQVSLPKTASTGSFLSILTFNIGGIVDSATVQAQARNNDFGKAWLDNNSAGSGPFRLVRWDRGNQVLLEANPNARLKPKLQRIILREIKEPAVLRTALESGEIDIAEGLTPESIRALRSNNKFRVMNVDTLRLNYLGMNVKEGSPFANAKVREALRWGINQSELVSGIIQGNGTAIQTIIPKGLLGYNGSATYKYDPVRAKRILTEAGLPNGFEFEIVTSTGQCGGGIPCADIAAKLQADLAKAGIKANIKAIASAEALRIYRAQSHQVYLGGWSPDFPDPDGNATPMSDFAARSLAWRNSWNDVTAARMANQAALEATDAKRTALYKLLTDYMVKSGPFVMLYQPSAPLGMSVNVQGYVRNAQSQVRFENISKTQ